MAWQLGECQPAEARWRRLQSSHSTTQAFPPVAVQVTSAQRIADWHLQQAFVSSNLASMLSVLAITQDNQSCSGKGAASCKSVCVANFAGSNPAQPSALASQHELGQNPSGALQMDLPAQANHEVIGLRVGTPSCLGSLMPFHTPRRQVSSVSLYKHSKTNHKRFSRPARCMDTLHAFRRAL